jgi:hypothetical protein
MTDNEYPGLAYSAENMARILRKTVVERLEAMLEGYVDIMAYGKAEEYGGGWSIPDTMYFPVGKVQSMFFDHSPKELTETPDGEAPELVEALERLAHGEGIAIIRVPVEWEDSYYEEGRMIFEGGPMMRYDRAELIDLDEPSPIEDVLKIIKSFSE